MRAYRQCKDFKTRVIQGVVIYRSGICIRLCDGNRLCLRQRCWNQDRAINIGDSIYKPANTFDMYIFRQANPDSVIFVRCDFDCRDHLINRIEQDPKMSPSTKNIFITSDYYD